MWFAFSEFTLTVGGGEIRLEDWVASTAGIFSSQCRSRNLAFALLGKCGSAGSENDQLEAR